ncbi:putative membrane-associated protein [Terriglobus roseus DSM 18391]|uniref:Putative membrane-associated protein n=1 Tax=Terriglobus roseus (strain DSM 18391 / NRRL B-41598 / KBS 63) TaxID=926566 RepID=I3ZDG3_TERRK|nr:VTT domain-containing protein [Terriglobus roseus]AFL87281.1 putative membrane-associated protein [Terriglobus roseus DSM 18391]
MILALLQKAAQTTTSATAHVRRPTTTGGKITRYFFRLGLLGLFFICVVDSSPVPLPIPGSSDILVVLLAAQRQAWLLVTVVATIGSIVGGAISYQTGAMGGLPLMDKYVPARFRDRLRRWTTEHALLSVALPALLPPPAPLMPFLIAAGALRMPRSRFFWSFTLSRFLRHAFYAWLGLHYGRKIMPLYQRFADHYGWILLVIVWGSIGFGIIYAIVKLRQRRHEQHETATTAAAA